MLCLSLVTQLELWLDELHQGVGAPIRSLARGYCTACSVKC
jgi:hypothetical protein